MTSKWKWISSKLKNILDYDPYNLSEKALEIDRALESIYGYTATSYFEEDLEKIEKTYDEMKNTSNRLKYIDRIARSVIYCVACCEHEGDCDSCKFAKKYGGCDEDDSPYGEFYIPFYRYVYG